MGVLHRHLAGPLGDALSDTPAVLINGARQTGKSTLVQSGELGKASRQYLTFDDPGLLAAAKRDPSGFIAGLNLPVTLDEVQHVPEIFPVIKSAIDRDRRPGQFLLEDRAGRVVGIEVKAAATLGSHDVRGLQAMADAVGKSWVRGVALYGGAEVVPFAANLHGIPLARLWPE